jgi:predicted nucleic acid-binding protein
MKIDCFLDTNVLIYAATAKEADPYKHGVARDLIDQKVFGISCQILTEFYVNVAHKKKVSLPEDEIDEWFYFLEQYPRVNVDFDLVRLGMTYAKRYQINYYDAAIIAAAERLGITLLYTEDLQHDQLYGSVRVENPFLTH